MTQACVPCRLRDGAGFSLLEAIIALGLMGLIVGALANVTAHWLPTWSRGAVRVQSVEAVATALDRVSADLAAAEFVTASRSHRLPLFEGTEDGVVFVRTAVGPNARPGLEFVRIAEVVDARGSALVRMRAPFVPLPPGGRLDAIPFRDPVVLVRSPLRVRFAYAGAGPARRWEGSWIGAERLPAAVRLTVENPFGPASVVRTAAAVRVNMPAPDPEGLPGAADQ